MLAAYIEVLSQTNQQTSEILAALLDRIEGLENSVFDLESKVKTLEKQVY